MGIDYSSIVDAPRDEVFAWHARPGVFARLSPPWQPMRLVQEAASLESGRAQLKLPGGVPWIAQHEAAAYDPPHRFVDRSVAWPAKVLVPWRHKHTFDEVTSQSTRVTDHVDTRVPAALLRSMFVYRHRELADDLARHGWAQGREQSPLTVAVTGSSGLVGSALTAFLTTGGHRVIRLVRRDARGADERRWDPDAPASNLLDSVDAVVHLAGASIAGRFTDSHRRAIRDSRVGPTRRLAQVAADADNGPEVFVSASAVGYYGPDRGDRTLTEESERGDGFLAEVVADWEGASAPAAESGVRTVQVRTGIVQTPRGGVLRLQWPLFEVGLGGRLGSGRQWLSWVDIDDLIDVYHRALFDRELSGPVNAVSPEPERNSDYTAVLASVLRRPALLPVPKIGPEMLLGEQGARELALADQWVSPAKLMACGHTFRRPELESCLRHQLGRFRNA